jgi:hypothetical protein
VIPRHAAFRLNSPKAQFRNPDVPASALWEWDRQQTVESERHSAYFCEPRRWEESGGVRWCCEQCYTDDGGLLTIVAAC